MHLNLSYCVVLCNRMIGLTVFAMECKGAGFLLVSVQSKQETGNGVITKCFEGEQESLLLHSALKWDRTDNKRYWVRERDSQKETIRVVLSLSYLGPRHWPYKCVTFSKLPNGVIKYAS